ncbi:transcription elongation factor, mitochondrial-like [Harpegnathos saltator]|uniref:transcription elongation factor, mitochondrial-like n=1 Tax=Harpegnathos saltator TaxID=610380 RepID=UPI00058F36E5|nr:transcription elongation factor, mitochondrial-like [Harpegnathos saltator]XP_025163131.1 transcription elongation factor, mitochondrial-like [Harpegnathos saltator]
MWNITRLFNNFIKHQKAQVSKHWGPSAIIFKMNSTDADAIDINLSSEEKNKILDIINYQNIEDLLQYSITKQRAQSLEIYRTNNGPYKSLEDLLKVKSISEKSLHKFLKSIINGDKKASKKITSGLVITPKVANGNQKDVNTILGIHVGQDIISWSLLNRDCEVLQWCYKSFTRSGTKENLHSLLQATLPIAAKLPKADRYVMQESGGNRFRKNGKRLYQACIEQSVINAIILTHLATLNSKRDIDDFVTNNIFILRQNILQKVYGLVVGNECVSTQYMIQRLLEENERLLQNKECLPSVHIKPEFQDMYKALSPINKEQISWSLLIALAFAELIVHERTDMKIRNSF